MTCLSVVLCLLQCACTAVAAPLNGEDIMREVSYVNRFGAVRNVGYGDREHRVVLIDLSNTGRLVVNTLQRWRRNDFPQGPVAASDLVIFRSGKLRGTGILVKEYREAAQGRAYTMWLPSLRKLRRFAEPDPADSWGNSNFSYGDIYTRRTQDEDHELLGREVFNGCLGVLRLSEAQRGRHTQQMPEAECSVDGRPVYRLRSRPRGKDLGYDERIVWVDTDTFADYRSLYYRNGKVQKVIDKAWRGMGLDDPRAQYWVYWYAHTPETGQQGMAYVPADAVRWNGDFPPDLWSERTLRQIRR